MPSPEKCGEIMARMITPHQARLLAQLFWSAQGRVRGQSHPVRRYSHENHVSTKRHHPTARRDFTFLGMTLSTHPNADFDDPTRFLQNGSYFVLGDLTVNYHVAPKIALTSPPPRIASPEYHPNGFGISHHPRLNRLL
jgi:hypothetical protein